MKKLILSAMAFWLCSISFAQDSELSVEYIMRDPVWMGTFPSSPYWSEDGKSIYSDTISTAIRLIPCIK